MLFVLLLMFLQKTSYVFINGYKFLQTLMYLHSLYVNGPYSLLFSTSYFISCYIHAQLTFVIRYCSDVTSHSLTILLLNSRNSSLFSWQLSVHVCRKSARVEPSVMLQITTLEYRFTRLTWGLKWVTGQFSLHLNSAEWNLLLSIVFSSLVYTRVRNYWKDWSRIIFQAISSHAQVN